LKRKREVDVEGDDFSGEDSNQHPKESLIASMRTIKKKPKLDVEAAGEVISKPDSTPIDEEEAARRNAYAEKRREKRERKKAKHAKTREKREAKKAETEQESKSVVDHSRAEIVTGDDRGGNHEPDSERAIEIDTLEHLDVNGFKDDRETRSKSSASPTPTRNSPTFDNSALQSSSSSTSSIQPASVPLVPSNTRSKSQKQNTGSLTKAQPLAMHLESGTNHDILIKHSEAEIATGTEPPNSETGTEALVKLPEFDINPETATDRTEGSQRPTEKMPKLPKIDSALLQQRLAARIEALRAARKADGLDGKPARNRQELIEARRRKQETRKQHKKELRTAAKQEQNAEDEAARLRGGSGSPLWASGVFPARGVLRNKEPENNFSFGRMAFEDGVEVDSTLTGLVDPRKKKGPQDPRTALEAAQKKKQRINGLDETKRADIEEKDRWLNAKKRIHGEKIKDDTSLLKKTLKRKDKGKLKSEKEWGERIEGVQKGQAFKQKKRKDNIAKRKEEKGHKDKGKAGKPKAPAMKKRPGFEGTFKSRNKPSI